jgi:hypothetical protein
MKNADVKLTSRLQNSVLILTSKKFGVTLSPFSRATLLSIQLAIIPVTRERASYRVYRPIPLAVQTNLGR